MLPHEKELVERLKDQPFALLGVNSDQPPPPEGTKLDRAAINARNERFHAARNFGPAGQVKLSEEEAQYIESARAALKKRLVDERIGWRNAVDGSTGGPWASRWNTRYWPHIFLIDKQGVIRHVDPGEDELESTIRALLAEEAPKK
ncbi:MAG: hypothetical protein IT454_11115 [Planctomycetes bacterium]|nr:hypothetical protein [Planctomycetota bacterium]